MIVVPNALLTGLALLVFCAGFGLIVALMGAVLVWTWGKLLANSKQARLLWWLTAQKLHGENANRALFWRALYSQAEKGDQHALEIAEQALGQRGMATRPDWQELRALIHKLRWGDEGLNED